MNEVFDTAVVVLAWLVPLLVGVWSWRGRSNGSRWWVGNSMNERVVRGLIPAWVVLVGSAFPRVLTEGTAWEPLGRNMTTVGIFAGAFFTVWTILLIPIPGWWAPRWFRELPQDRRRPGTKDAFDAAVALSELEPLRTSEELFRARRGGARELGSWSANYVYDPDTLERAHGLVGRGMVAGRLSLFADRVMFCANEMEDTLRREPTLLEFEHAAITDIRVVPARAGADGVSRPGLLYRSLLPRLLVGTVGADYVFEVVRARHVAGKIGSARAAAVG